MRTVNQSLRLEENSKFVGKIAVRSVLTACCVYAAKEWASVVGGSTYSSRTETSGRTVYLSATVSHQQDRWRQILCKCSRGHVSHVSWFV